MRGVLKSASILLFVAGFALFFLGDLSAVWIRIDLGFYDKLAVGGIVLMLIAVATNWVASMGDVQDRGEDGAERGDDHQPRE